MYLHSSPPDGHADCTGTCCTRSSQRQDGRCSVASWHPSGCPSRAMPLCERVRGASLPLPLPRPHLSSPILFWSSLIVSPLLDFTDFSSPHDPSVTSLRALALHYLPLCSRSSALVCRRCFRDKLCCSSASSRGDTAFSLSSLILHLISHHTLWHSVPLLQAISTSRIFIHIFRGFLPFILFIINDVRRSRETRIQTKLSLKRHCPARPGPGRSRLIRLARPVRPGHSPPLPKSHLHRGFLRLASCSARRQMRVDSEF